MAYLDLLTREIPNRLRTYFTRTGDGKGIDLSSLIRSAPADALLYVCGPAGLIEAARHAAREQKLPSDRLRYENFA